MFNDIENPTAYINGLIAECYYTAEPLTDKEAARVLRYMRYAEKRDPYLLETDYLDFAMERYGYIDWIEESFAAAEEAERLERKGENGND